jgi:hypothetical protein
MSNIKSQHRVNTFGEVMTPNILVNEMLDTIPQDVWRNPKLKWIDNSCGNGNFLVEVKNRLLKFHTEKHILDNMLYGIDIQLDNVQETIERLKGGNIVHHDALTFNYWNIKFDVVVGNPPYNKEKKGKKGNNCNPLWTIFVDFILDNVLAENGFMCLVHPALWRKPEHKLWNKIKKYQLHFIRIFSLKDASSIFGVATKADYYLLQKREANLPTTIIGEDNISIKVRVYDKPFIPNHSFTKVYDFFNGNTNIIYNCKYHHYTHSYMKPTKDNINKYPCVYLANKKGITFQYSSENIHGHFGVPKIIIPLGSFQPILDAKGEYGMCEVAFGIPIDSIDHGNKLMKVLSSSTFMSLLSACKWKTMQLDYRLFKYFNANL